MTAWIEVKKKEKVFVEENSDLRQKLLSSLNCSVMRRLDPHKLFRRDRTTDLSVYGFESDGLPALPL